jgi:deoxyribonuclease IV
VLFGAHMSSAGGIDTSIDRIEAIGGNALQVFTQSPRMWRHTNHTPEAVARFRERREEAGVQSVVCHALYLVNLAATDATIREKSLTALRATMETADAIGAEAVIFHAGSHLGVGFDRIVEEIRPALVELCELTTDRLWLCLENCAGTGGTIGRSVAELVTIVDALDRHPRLGVCIDSCHWWASGVDVSDRVALDAAVKELDDRVGIDRVRCLHVNDSKTPLGSNRDRHDNVGKGLIGKGLSTFLAHPAFQGLPAILETPGPDGHGPDEDELKALKALHKRGVAAERRRSRR